MDGWISNIKQWLKRLRRELIVDLTQFLTVHGCFSISLQSLRFNMLSVLQERRGISSACTVSMQTVCTGMSLNSDSVVTSQFGRRKCRNSGNIQDTETC